MNDFRDIGVIGSGWRATMLRCVNRFIFCLVFCIVLSMNLSAIDSIEEVRSWKIGNVDSIKFYLPEYDGVYIFESQTRKAFLCELKKSNIPPHILYNTSDSMLISNIKGSINRASIRCKLPFDVSEIVLEAFTSPDLNKYPPGMHWRYQDRESVRGCAIIYGDKEPRLIWFGLEFVDIENFRLDCRLFELFNVKSKAE